jgi:hypothetical protein
VHNVELSYTWVQQAATRGGIGETAQPAQSASAAERAAAAAGHVVAVMAALREVIEKKGSLCALYSDRGSHFFVTPKAGEPANKGRSGEPLRSLASS